MPQGRPHENWEEASCSCGESPPNCTITLHKRVLADGDKWVEQKMVRRGRCVPCGAGVVPGMPEYPGAPGVEPTGGQRNICGPDITAALAATLRDIERTYMSWTLAERRSACDAISSLNPYVAAHAFDILDLRGFDAYAYSAGRCGLGRGCRYTVEVSGGCYSAAGVNYVELGRMWLLCGFYPSLMRNRIDLNRLWRVWDPVTYWEALLWGTLGYEEWPSGAFPTGYWRECAPACAVRYPPGAMTWCWDPVKPCPHP
jgi:hypothetical protein